MLLLYSDTSAASTVPAPDDEITERFQPAADIRCFKRPAVIPHELSGEPVNVALPHGTGLRRGLPELSLPVLDAVFQPLVFLPQRIQLLKVLGEFSGYFVACILATVLFIIGCTDFTISLAVAPLSSRASICSV